MQTILLKGVHIVGQPCSYQISCVNDRFISDGFKSRLHNRLLVIIKGIPGTEKVKK